MEGFSAHNALALVTARRQDSVGTLYLYHDIIAWVTKRSYTKGHVGGLWLYLPTFIASISKITSQVFKSIPICTVQSENTLIFLKTFTIYPLINSMYYVFVYNHALLSPSSWREGIVFLYVVGNVNVLFIVSRQFAFKLRFPSVSVWPACLTYLLRMKNLSYIQIIVFSLWSLYMLSYVVRAWTERS